MHFRRGVLHFNIKHPKHWLYFCADLLFGLQIPKTLVKRTVVSHDDTVGIEDNEEQIQNMLIIQTAMEDLPQLTLQYTILQMDSRQGKIFIIR